ncbi:MAG: ABC transporter substrate-binding protein [Gammaproteobacteria bacterium]|nr:ABC transporter substrate-binding protein [Gammaproteobacteria bacterium]
MNINRYLPLLSLLFLLVSPTGQAIEKECPRIVSQSPYLTKSLQWLGLEPCIVGVSRYDTLKRPHTGGVMDPDGEAIEALEPELIFTSNWTRPELLKAITPKGVRAFALDGFESMAQVEENLQLMGSEAGLADIDARVAAFHQEWTTVAASINGRGKKVLLLSACSGSPYSFGKKRWLSDLFTRANFVNVETSDKIRHIKAGAAVTTLNALINELKPELLFIFERKANSQCAFIKPETPLTLINLDGEKFLHPAPVLLDGLTELATHRAKWSH